MCLFEMIKIYELLYKKTGGLIGKKPKKTGRKLIRKTMDPRQVNAALGALDNF